MHRQLMRAIGLVAALFIALTGALATAATPTGASAQPQQSAPTPAISNGMCLACHKAGLAGAPKVSSGVLAHSVHAKLHCTSCHTEITQLPHPKNLGRVDCGSCHKAVAHELAVGTHAPKTPSSSNTPSCMTCHGTHSINMVSSPAFRRTVAARCASCHQGAYQSYIDSPHGQASVLGLQSAARCEDCHNPHLALPASNPKSQIAAANLQTTCGKCHAGVNKKFTEFDPHAMPSSAARSSLLHYIDLFMIGLIVAVFAFFGLHTLLWLQRSAVALWRGEVARARRAGAIYIKRFSGIDRSLHVIMIVSFMLLALTGLPLMYAHSPWAQFLANAFSGVQTMRLIHLANAAITFGYFIYHLAYLAYRIVIKKQTFELFGPDSLIPSWQDLADIGKNVRWFLYLGPKPSLDRWTYWEKFDYWAVFWGIAIIGVSGLFLAAPSFWTSFVPGVGVNVAFVVHGEEALLATGFIFIFHFFHNHMRPENFPVDLTIFTGRLPLERFKEERPLQYQRLVDEERLDDLLVGPPSRFATFTAAVFGAAVIITGIGLVVCVLAL